MQAALVVSGAEQVLERRDRHPVRRFDLHLLLYAHTMLDRRLQILLDEKRHDRLLAVARARGVSVATVVREAIDRGLPAPDDRRRAAAARLLDDAPDMPVPDVGGLRVELDAVRRRRG